MDNITYRQATPGDLIMLMEPAILLYDEHTYEEIHDEMSESLDKDDEAIFISLDKEKAIGFAHCTIRHDYVEGTHGGAVGYLEGICVLPSYRRKGIAKNLVTFCEKWAKKMGCKEFASDCQLSNTESYDFHLRIGFKEAGKIICFTKDI